MKISEIIRERRLAKNFTQEQMARYLGVTAPAVNKWEKGATYPDITLLPALARLLDTDLNTLLSFQDDLTEREIGSFITQLAEGLEENGFQKTYEWAKEKIREYPTCHMLILRVAMFLDGSLSFKFAKVGEGEYEEYRSCFEALYERVLDCGDPFVRMQAQSALIGKYMGRGEYGKAEELLGQLPDKNPVDKQTIQAAIWIADNKLEEAEKLQGGRLFTAVNEVHAILTSLMEIAIKEGRDGDAEYVAGICKKAAELFEMSEYSAHSAHFLLYCSRKEREKCLEALVPMLKESAWRWGKDHSPLYRRIANKEMSKEAGGKMRKALVSSIFEDEEAAFLRDDGEVKRILKEMDMDMDGGD